MARKYVKTGLSHTKEWIQEYHREYNKTRRKPRNTPEERAKSAAQHLAWKKANPEKAKAARRRRRDRHRGKRQRVWDEKLASMRQQRLDLKAKKRAERIALLTEQKKQTRERNRLKQRAKYLNNKPYYSAARALRRARKRNAAIGHDQKAVTAIYARAKSNQPVKCYLCGKLIQAGQRHVDHIVPLAKGGEHAAGNLGITHEACNRKKHLHTLDALGWLPFAA